MGKQHRGVESGGRYEDTKIKYRAVDASEIKRKEKENQIIQPMLNELDEARSIKNEI